MCLFIDTLTQPFKLLIHLFIHMNGIIAHVVMAGTQPHDKSVTLRSLPPGAFVYVVPMQIPRSTADEAFIRVAL